MGIIPSRLKPDNYISFFSEFNKKSPLLATDYDGTLTPFVKEREKAFIPPKTRYLLKSISEAGGKLIIISGRKPQEIYDFVNLPIEIWGCHGMERMDQNGISTREYIPETEMKKLDDFTSQLDYFPKGSVEKKPSGIALHWRDRPEIYDMYKEVSVKLLAEASAHSLNVMPFNGGVEFKLPYFTKGTAITDICTIHRETSILCYLGDDTTDEDAFREIKNINSGIGILVAENEKESAADVYISPNEIDLFLGFWLYGLVLKGGGCHVRK